MRALKAHVRGGRLLLDEPTDLPNGEVVELVPLDEVLANGGDYLDAEERERLHASIDRGLEDVHAGRTTEARHWRPPRSERRLASSPPGPLVARGWRSKHEREGAFPPGTGC